MGRHLLALSFLLANIVSFSQWRMVGDSGFSHAPADNPFFAINPVNSTPYIAFKDAASSARGSVMMYENSKWVYVGKQGFSNGAGCITMAFNSSGIPYVVFTDGSQNAKLTVMRYVDNDWVTVGNPGFTSKPSSFCSISIHPDGTPYVTFRDLEYEYKASVMKFDGSNWVYVGQPGFSTSSGRCCDGAGYTSLTFDKTGVPYVAYSDVPYDFKATVQKFDGNSWVYVGAPGFAEWNAQYTRSMAFDSNNRPYIVCLVNGQTTALRFENGKWNELAKQISTMGGSEYASIAIDKNDNVFIGCQDYGVTRRGSVLKFDGSRWNFLGEQGFTPSSVKHSTIDVDKEGSVYMGFQDNNTVHWYASVMKFEQSVIDVHENPAAAIDLAIYPNPSSNTFNLICSEITDASICQLKIYNLHGQTCYLDTLSVLNGGFIKQLNLNSFSRGVYLIEISTDKTSIKKRLVLQ